MFLLILIIQFCNAAPYSNFNATELIKEVILGSDIAESLGSNYHHLESENIRELFQSFTYEDDPLTDMDECKLCSDVIIPTFYTSLSVSLARIILEVASDGEALGVLECFELYQECQDTCWYLECLGCAMLPFICAEVLLEEAILMSPLEVVIHAYLMESNPPYYVCEEAGYCSGAVTRQM